MSKEKKKVRNKTRDMLADYYRTNKEYSEENKQRQQEEGKKGWSGTEKLYLIVIILGVIGIFLRYVVFR